MSYTQIKKEDVALQNRILESTMAAVDSVTRTASQDICEKKI